MEGLLSTGPTPSSFNTAGVAAAAPLLGVAPRPLVKCDSCRELAGGLLLPGSIEGTLIRDQESSLLPGEQDSLTPGKEQAAGRKPREKGKCSIPLDVFSPSLLGS